MLYYNLQLLSTIGAGRVTYSSIPIQGRLPKNRQGKMGSCFPFALLIYRSQARNAIQASADNTRRDMITPEDQAYSVDASTRAVTRRREPANNSPAPVKSRRCKLDRVKISFMPKDFEFVDVEPKSLGM